MHDKSSLKEMQQEVIEGYLKYREEQKIHPSWKKLRPNKDALNYRLQGSITK